MKKNKKSTTKLCKHCKTEIPSAAKVCPNCRKKQGLGGCATGVIVVIIILMIAFAFGNNDDNNNSANTTNASSGNQHDQTEEATTSNIFYVGDILETKKVKLTYLSCGEYSDSNIFVEPAEGNKFVYFEFEFENISSSDVSVGSIEFSCYADGYDVQQALITADNSLVSITTLSPGRKVNGIVVFEVPANTVEIEVEYETDFWTQDKAVFIYN